MNVSGQRASGRRSMKVTVIRGFNLLLELNGKQGAKDIGNSLLYLSNSKPMSER